MCFYPTGEGPGTQALQGPCTALHKLPSILHTAMESWRDVSRPASAYGSVGAEGCVLLVPPNPSTNPPVVHSQGRRKGMTDLRHFKLFILLLFFSLALVSLVLCHPFYSSKFFH